MCYWQGSLPLLRLPEKQIPVFRFQKNCLRLPGFADPVLLMSSAIIVEIPLYVINARWLNQPFHDDLPQRSCCSSPFYSYLFNVLKPLSFNTTSFLNCSISESTISSTSC